MWAHSAGPRPLPACGLQRRMEVLGRQWCSVVYGALPPETRRLQARLFDQEGSGFAVRVASDAAGMGLNLSIRRIVFSTLSKFSGQAKQPTPTPMVLLKPPTRPAAAVPHRVDSSPAPCPGAPSPACCISGYTVSVLSARQSFPPLMPCTLLAGEADCREGGTARQPACGRRVGDMELYVLCCPSSASLKLLLFCAPHFPEACSSEPLHVLLGGH